MRIQIVEQKLYLLAWFCGKVRAIFPFFVFQSLLKAELLEIPFTSNFITISQIYSSLTTGSLVLTVNIFRRQKIKSLCIHGIHIYRKFMIIEIKKFDIRKASRYYFLSNRSHLQIVWISWHQKNAGITLLFLISLFSFFPSSISLLEILKRTNFPHQLSPDKLSIRTIKTFWSDK